MAKHGDRFTVIEGGAEAREGFPMRRVSDGKPATSEPHICKPCSDQLGQPYGVLALVLRGASVIDGKLFGGTRYWACQRCERIYFDADPVAED